jgi:hypothetical protein
MPWSLVWVFTALLHSAPEQSPFAAGLATAAAVLIAVVLAASSAASALPAADRAHGFPAATRRRRTRATPRLIDPDAAGRPRSRAPSPVPSAA